MDEADAIAKSIIKPIIDELEELFSEREQAAEKRHRQLMQFLDEVSKFHAELYESLKAARKDLR